MALRIIANREDIRRRLTARHCQHNPRHLRGAQHLFDDVPHIPAYQTHHSSLIYSADCSATIPQAPCRQHQPCYNARPMPMNSISTSIKTRALPLLLALALALVLARPVAAHANLLRSEPAAGALLDRSPPSLTLEFSEELDPAFSQAQLFDRQNQLVEPGPGAVDPATPRVLRLILPDLPKGSYTALWRVRSAI